MKLLTFYKENRHALGVKVSEGIIDLEVALEAANEHMKKYDFPLEMMAFIEAGEDAVHNLQMLLTQLQIYKGAPFLRQEHDITFAPAVPNPSKIICVGLNYRKHADETKAAYPEVPVLFNKFNNALTGHLSDVVVPRTTERLDHEVELGIVIGKKGKYIQEEDALDYVFGYCTTNDLSARDIQKRTSQWMTGKTNDGFAPVGPYVVTKDEIADPNNLNLKTIVNGEVRQNSNTRDMIFSCKALISYISTYMTLEPGDLIMTGTPEGVILGKPREERVYLQPGDEVTVEVEGLGKLTINLVEDK